MADWSQYRKSPIKESQSGTAIEEMPTDWSAFRKEPIEQEKTFTQKIAQSAPAQFILGLAKRATFPADLAKLSARGGAENARLDLSESESDVFPSLRHKLERPQQPIEPMPEVVEKGLEYFPTQESVEKLIGTATGVGLAPEERSAKLARSAGELFTGKPASPQQAVKGVTGAIAGAFTEEKLIDAGVPAPVASIVSALISGSVSGGKVEPKKLTGEQLEARETAEKFGLRKFAGMEREKSPSIKPAISKKTEEKLREELGATSKKAIEKAIQEDIPVAKMVKEGVNVNQAYKTAFELARERAQKSTKPVDVTSVKAWIKNERDRILAHAPSPSAQDEVALKILANEEKALAKNAYDSNTILNQFQNYNKNLKGIYRKPEFAGAEGEVSRVYGELKDRLIKSVEKSGNQDVVEPFKFANKLYHENEKLAHTEAILAPAFKDGYDPKKLAKILTSQRGGRFLMRYLGKDALSDINQIVKYGQQAEKKIFEQVKTSPDFIKELKSVSTIATDLLMGHKIAGAKLGLQAMNRLRGLLFTRDSSRKSYLKFLKAASTGNKRAMERAAKSLEVSIKSDYGSTDRLLELAINPLTDTEENIE